MSFQLELPVTACMFVLRLLYDWGQDQRKIVPAQQQIVHTVFN